LAAKKKSQTAYESEKNAKVHSQKKKTFCHPFFGCEQIRAKRCALFEEIGTYLGWLVPWGSIL
jgi:hypothetical protein